MDPFSFLNNLPSGVKKSMLEIIEHYGTSYSMMIKSTNRGKVKAAKTMHRLVDQKSKEFLKDNPSTCKAGCSYCCHVFVYATIDEAQLITNHCIHHNIELDMEVLKIQGTYTKENWVSQKHNKCIFLKDNMCSIYDIRPLTCRKYFVNSDPKLCDISMGPNRIRILNNVEAELMVSGVYDVRNPDSLPKMLLKVLN